MKIYIIRSLRYIIKMTIILGIVFVILHFTGTLNTGGGNLFEALFMSRKGLILLGALLLLAALYPKLSFTSVYVRGDMDENRREILEAFDTLNYTLVKEGPQELVFRVKSIGKRVMLQFDDTITVTRSEGYIVVEGLKREVVRIELRLNAFIQKG